MVSKDARRLPSAGQGDFGKAGGFRCSNPACRKPTSGPLEDPAKAINIGVAAHITAAAPDGPRYNLNSPLMRGFQHRTGSGFARVAQNSSITTGIAIRLTFLIDGRRSAKQPPCERSKPLGRL